MAKNDKQEAAAETEKKPMQVDRSKYSYGSTKVLDAEGRMRSMTSNGDAIAQVMAHADTPEKVAAIAKANGLTGRVEQGPSAFTNAGQFRMTLGNMLRAKVKRGEAVTVAGIAVKKLDQKIPIAPAMKAAEEKARERAKDQERKAKEAAKAAAEKAAKPAKATAAKSASTTAAQDAKATAAGKALPTGKAAGSGGKMPSTETAKAKTAEAAKNASKSRGKSASTEKVAGSTVTS